MHARQLLYHEILSPALITPLKKKEIETGSQQFAQGGFELTLWFSLVFELVLDPSVLALQVPGFIVLHYHGRLADVFHYYGDGDGGHRSVSRLTQTAGAKSRLYLKNFSSGEPSFLGLSL